MKSVHQQKVNYIGEVFKIFFEEELGSEDIDWEDTGKMFDEFRSPILHDGQDKNTHRTNSTQPLQ